MNTTTVNIFISFDCGESVLVHILSNLCNLLSYDTLKKWAEKATGSKVLDICSLTDNELQYYCIDGRVFINTEKEAKTILEQVK